MAGTSDKAVSDYIHNLFFDEMLPPVAQPFCYQPLDSVDVACRLQPCHDPFALMTMAGASEYMVWEAFLQLLLLGQSLPQGQVQRYVFKQSQILFQNIRVKPQG
ncbi:MAG: hypothetical protein ACI8SR_002423 [Oceanicoccus sp.]|jgi:hypothetical protein